MPFSTADPPVWYAIPSARPDGGTLRLWDERGYSLAIQRDFGFSAVGDICFHRKYRGYAEAVNFLCFEILKRFPETQVIVTGGDDIEPDPDHPPEVIQRAFVKKFPDLYGVMQPTGDRWMVDETGKSASERVAYSPWMGREWCLKVNQGTGPIWHEYWHFFEDEEHQHVAMQQGVFAQAPNIVQKHHHWQRDGGRTRPSHLQKVDRPEKWKAAKLLFERRKAAGFPGSEAKR